MKIRAALFLALLTALAQAGPRTSSNYTVATDVTNTGGQRATSTHYTNNASAGGVAGVSTVGSP